MSVSAKWSSLKADQKEGLEIIAAKISRILNGDLDYPDGWDDIAGCATLVANRLRSDSSATRTSGEGWSAPGASPPAVRSPPRRPMRTLGQSGPIRRISDLAVRRGQARGAIGGGQDPKSQRRASPSAAAPLRSRNQSDIGLRFYQV